MGDQSGYNAEDVDWYAKDMEPEKFEYKLFYIRMPKVCERKTGDTVSCHLKVDQYGYCELLDWYNFGKRDPHEPYNSETMHLRDAEIDVWEWLAEWELVELRPIGPEDSEYFATEKLIPEDKVKIINE